ncbi:MAG: undecaprenyl-diphosphate phosphatase [Acidobacteriota bacterium]
MSLLQVILLALVQGITEFLPISSSAHLILVPLFLDWADQGLSFDVATNTGTLLAVVLYFRRDLAQLVRGLLAEGGGDVEGLPARHFLLAWALATAPVAIAGFLLADQVATVARDPRVILATTVGFGLVLALADRIGRRDRRLASLALVDAWWIGLAQAIALIPGTSRSGITLSMALLLGFRRPAAARFAFLMAIPVGILAAAWDGLKIVQGEVPLADLPSLGLGLLVAAGSAYLTIGWLLRWVERQNLSLFVIYRLVLGGIIAVVLL